MIFLPRWERVTNFEGHGYMEGRRQISRWRNPGQPDDGVTMEHDTNRPLEGPPPKSLPPDPFHPGTQHNL